MAKARARPARAKGRGRRSAAPAAAARPAASGAPALAFHPATAERWRDVEKLFGPRGACAGCWCMWARLPGGEFRAGVGDPNKRALRRLVGSDEPPGILAYVDGEPAGWVGLGPRADFRRLEKSKILAPVDDRPAWSVVCFFVARPFRRQGLSSRMLSEAVRHAGARGATVVEGYPTDTTKKSADAFVWTGLASAFERAGFREVARRSPTRPIMRRVIRGVAGGRHAAAGARTGARVRRSPRAVARG
jgi:GNAT superfamily N-acetyltransferase